MTSILTNAAAMSALQTLRSINNNMDETQAHVSTGLRVGSAADNAAYWSIATTMRSDNMALSAVQDALGLGAAKVDTAYAGMNSSIDVVKEIKKKLVTATEDGVDKTKINEEIKQLQGQLKSISEAASFSGENWLEANISGGSLDKASVVASFVRDSSGSVSVKKVDYTLDATTVLFDKAGSNTGILDQKNSTGKDGVVVNVNVNGTVGSTNVVKYTTAEVSTAVTAATGGFDAGGKIAWTVASDGAGAGRGYVMVGNDTWVEAVEQDKGVNNGQETFATDAGTNLWAIDLTKASTDGSESVSGFSISNATTSEELDGLIQNVDNALKSMTSAASALGSISSRIGLQEEFVSQLSSAIDKGVGRLVDADMNEESTRLKALQTQQQLAIQSLSIANSASQNVLSLFR